jgi:hypothetical protein
VGGAPRSRHLAQLGAEQGAADSWRAGVACLPGASAFATLVLSSLLLSFLRLSLRCGTHRFCLLVAGAGAPRPRQVQRPRPDER